jgi:hypothetical protein
MPGKHKGRGPHGPREWQLKRDEEIWGLRTNKAWTHHMIAVHMGLDESTVTRSLQRTAKRKSENLDDRVQEYRESLRQLLDQIIADTYAAWTKSQEEDKPSPASSQYITANLKAIERLSKILGLESGTPDPSGLTNAVDLLKEIEKRKETN